MTDELVPLLIKKFISRADVKAQQWTRGDQDGYSPVIDPDTKIWQPWDRTNITEHLNCERTFGHYMLDTDNKCKLFAFDIDLNDTGFWINETDIPVPGMIEFNPRLAWRDRQHPSRTYIKIQFREIANALMRVIHETLQIPTAAAYSGNKGIHVYGFTGRMEAAEVRIAAQIVLDTIGGFEILRGKNFYYHSKWSNFTIETYPKQDQIGSSGLGNLMRLPLGCNLKAPKDPTFFINVAAPLATLSPIDPIYALTTNNPWKLPNE